MNGDEKKEDAVPKLKELIICIIATGAVVSAVWGFFFYKMVELKNQEITILEKSEPNALKGIRDQLSDLHEKIVPVSLAFQFDKFDGRISLGAGMSGPTEVTKLIIKAEELRKDKKFDLAAAKIDEIEAIHPSFPSIPYLRFLIEKDKGNEKEALAYAEQAIEGLPESKRIFAAYAFAVETNLKLANKKKAEDLCLTMMRLDPENSNLREFFKSSFGYEANIPKEKE